MQRDTLHWTPACSFRFLQLVSTIRYFVFSPIIDNSRWKKRKLLNHNYRYFSLIQLLVVNHEINDIWIIFFYSNYQLITVRIWIIISIKKSTFLINSKIILFSIVSSTNEFHSQQPTPQHSFLSTPIKIHRPLWKGMEILTGLPVRDSWSPYLGCSCFPTGFTNLPPTLFPPSHDVPVLSIVQVRG